MEILYYKDPVGNFGDDLNELIWPRLLPDDVRNASNTVLVGIGSLLNRDLFKGVDLTAKHVYTLGSGAAYGRLPNNMRSWNFLALRGRLTARLVERPEAAITDGAALLSCLPELAPRSAHQNETIFIPHHSSVSYGNWAAAAALAGFTYVDPQWDPSRILAHYGRAKLVIAEAMHGAIVADTLRIPWTPVLITPKLSVFKWRDWLSSLELPYEPVALPPSSWAEALKHERLRRAMHGSGISSASMCTAKLDDDELIKDFDQRNIKEQPQAKFNDKHRRLRSITKQLVPLVDKTRVPAAAEALRKAAAGRSYLSADDVFAERLGGLQGAVERLVSEVRKG